MAPIILRLFHLLLIVDAAFQCWTFKLNINKNQSARQLNSSHSFRGRSQSSAETLLSSYLAKKEAAAEAVELGVAEVAAGEPVSEAAFVCEGECVLERFRVASFKLSLGASEL